ncbi:hypothetical protein DVH05_004106 [Phytophthora capsici]|nr:hypothetical protein DVH05_004106 [Phytophthora capsici]
MTDEMAGEMHALLWAFLQQDEIVREARTELFNVLLQDAWKISALHYGAVFGESYQLSLGAVVQVWTLSKLSQRDKPGKSCILTVVQSLYSILPHPLSYFVRR